MGLRSQNWNSQHSPVKNEDVMMMMHNAHHVKKHGGARMTVKVTMGQFNPQGISPETGLSCAIYVHAPIY